jgi:hypothetical protein
MVAVVSVFVSGCGCFVSFLVVFIRFYGCFVSVFNAVVSVLLR